MAGGTKLGFVVEAFGVDHAGTSLTVVPAASAAGSAGLAVPLQATPTAGAIADLACGKAIFAVVLATVLAVIPLILISEAAAVGAGDSLPVLQADIRGMGVVLAQDGTDGQEGVTEPPLLQSL